MVEAARQAQARHAGRPACGGRRRSAARRASSCARAASARSPSARAFHIQNEWPKGIGNPPNEEPPKDFDWDSLARAGPEGAYNKNRTFYRFRWFYDYSGGQLTNFGVHYLDVIHWALGQDAPLAVAAMGGKFAVEDNREVPDTLEVLWTLSRQHAGDVLAVQRQRRPGRRHERRDRVPRHQGDTSTSAGQRLRGRAGRPDRQRVPGPHAGGPRRTRRGYRDGGQAGDRAEEGHGRQVRHGGPRPQLPRLRQEPRDACNCDIELGHRDTTAALIGNIAHKTKSYLEWDAKAERFTNNEAANDRLRYEYREPYQLPT